ncbi:MAG: hypothetical protein M5R36_03700 [Deltaproteobacteria bacterium]|nr:hypothetical protein [Deltaproteobacteria bacterium]
MFEAPRLFFGRKKCRQCGSRKLSKIISRVSGHVERTETELMNDLKGMGNVNFIPEWMMKRPEPPGGVCPYHAEQQAKEKTDKEKERKAREPIVIS